MLVADYTLISNLEEFAGDVQPKSLVSRTFCRDNGLKALLFGFDAGQELCLHTSNKAAMIQIVKGDATVTLENNPHELSAGKWINVPPQLKNTILANTPLLMLWLMLDST